ncbi:MAG TPA: hypothetical protein PKC22_09850, partial [Rhodocyclaceae bacterium]|nr:hypothetical protein [Rhodocyclaceae bacterium]
MTALMEQAADQISPGGVPQATAQTNSFARAWRRHQWDRWTSAHLKLLIVVGGGLMVAVVLGFGLLTMQQLREAALQDAE